MKSLDVKNRLQPRKTFFETEEHGSCIRNESISFVVNGDSNRGMRARFVFSPARSTNSDKKSPTCKVLPLVEAGFSFRASVAWREQLPGIRSAVILYCARGRGWCELSGQRHKIRAGDLIVFPVQTPHICRLREEQPCLVAWIRTNAANLDIFSHHFGTNSESSALDLRAETRLPSLFDKWLHEIKVARSYADLASASQTLQKILNTVVRCCSERPNGKLTGEQRIEASINYLKMHLSKPFNVTTLAALADMSPSHFAALFKRRTGCAPIEFFTKLRMTHASHLLDSTSMRLKDIATRLGYKDPFYFSRVFKSAMRVSPREYRARIRNSRGEGSTSRQSLPALKNQNGTENPGARCCLLPA